MKPSCRYLLVNNGGVHLKTVLVALAGSLRLRCHVRESILSIDTGLPLSLSLQAI